MFYMCSPAYVCLHSFNTLRIIDCRLAGNEVLQDHLNHTHVTTTMTMTTFDNCTKKRAEIWTLYSTKLQCSWVWAGLVLSRHGHGLNQVVNCDWFKYNQMKEYRISCCRYNWPVWFLAIDCLLSNENIILCSGRDIVSGVIDTDKCINQTWLDDRPGALRKQLNKVHVMEVARGSITS